jgi:hypothetical protein
MAPAGVRSEVTEGSGGVMVVVDQSRSRERDTIWVESPFGEPAPRVVVAAARTGALGVWIWVLVPPAPASHRPW